MSQMKLVLKMASISEDNNNYSLNSYYNISTEKLVRYLEKVLSSKPIKCLIQQHWQSYNSILSHFEIRRYNN